VLIGVWLFFSIRKQNLKITIPQVLPQEGFSIPIGGYRYSESLLYGKSARLTNFKLFDDHFEFGPLNSYKLFYNKIKDVGCIKGYYGKVGVEITFNDSDKIFYAGLNKNNLREVLVFLKGKGCKLTEKGESFIAGTN
jgi:hypothetical protein